MKNLAKTVLLSLALLAVTAMSGCVYVPARPGYASVWVPGHRNTYGYWIPGHYR